MKSYFVDLFIIGYDDAETETETPVTNETPVETPPPAAADPPPKKRVFEQEEVNAMMAKDKRALKAQNEQLAKTLEEVQKNQRLTEEERSELAAQIENLRTQHLTAEEKAKRERKKLETEHQTALEKKTKEAEEWRNRYTTEKIQRTILDASVANEAFSPEQIISFLRPETRLADVLDEEGRPTGELTPKVKFQSKNAEGKSVTLDLTVDEAVKAMKEDVARFGNLFKSNATGGFGGNNSPGVNGKLNFRNLTPAQYMKIRETDRETILR